MSKMEVNDESKETKCTQIINPTKKKIDWIFETNIEFFLFTFWNWKESQGSIW
jgi:hypothetical protein